MGDTLPAPDGLSTVVNDRGLKIAECVVIKDHVTNNGSRVQLSRIDYSEGMRSYRLYRVGQMGTIADNKAILHLMGPNDVFLLFLGVLFGFLLTPAFREGTPHWVSEDAKLADSETSPTKSWLKIGVVVVCFGLFILRMLLTFQRVYVEEVLAIRGVGIQIVSYGVFNNVKRIKFIDWKMIRSLVIHDSFFRYRPIFFLSSSIENESERLVYFDSFMPRLEVLQPVLRGLRHILLGDEEVGPTLSELEAEERYNPTVAEDSGADESTLLNGSEMDSSVLSDT